MTFSLRSRLLQPWKPRVWQDVVILLLRCGLGFLFLYAAWHKWVEGPAAFVKIVYQQEQAAAHALFPARWLPALSLVLMGLETAVGMGLLLGFWTLEWSFLATGLFIGFSVFLIRSIRYGVQVSCGCFGTSTDPPTWSTWVLHDLLPGLGALLLFGLCIRREILGKPPRT